MTESTAAKKPVAKYAVLGAIGLMVGVRMIGGSGNTGTQPATNAAQIVPPAIAQTQDQHPPAAPPVQPAYGDIGELIAMGMGEYSEGHEARAEQYLKSAQATGNAELYLIRQLAEKYEALSAKAQKYGTFGGSIDEAQVVRDEWGEALAILRAMQLIEDGKTATGTAAQPKEFLAVLRDRLGQYAIEYPQLAEEWSNGR